MDLLAPAEMPPVARDNSAQAQERSMSSNMRVVIQQSLAQKQPGLLSRLAGLQLKRPGRQQVARFQVRLVELGPETAAIESLISQLKPP